MGIGPITISVLGRFAAKEHVSPFIQILFYGFTQPRSGIPGLRVQFSADWNINPKIILVRLPRFEPEPTPSQGGMLPVTPQRGWFVEPYAGFGPATPVWKTAMFPATPIGLIYFRTSWRIWTPTNWVGTSHATVTPMRYRAYDWIWTNDGAVNTTVLQTAPFARLGSHKHLVSGYWDLNPGNLFGKQAH